MVADRLLDVATALCTSLSAAQCQTNNASIYYLIDKTYFIIRNDFREFQPRVAFLFAFFRAIVSTADVLCVIQFVVTRKSVQNDK